MSVDKQSSVPVVSQVLTALPLKEVFAAPLVAAIEAHNSACSALEQFIERVGRNPKTGEITTLQFRYSQQSVSAEPSQRSIEVPLIAMLPLPAFAVDRLSVDFDVKIDAGEAATDSTSKELGGELALGYGPVALKLKGSVTSKSEQTRKSDTSARYTVHLEASRQPMPEAFQRVIEALIAEVIPRDSAGAVAAATSPVASTPSPTASSS